MATPSKATARPKTSTASAKKPPRVAPSRAARPKAPGLITGDITPEMRHQMIAEAAYLRAEQRGFTPGDPLDDWLNAEREVDRLLNDRAAPITQ